MSKTKTIKKIKKMNATGTADTTALKKNQNGSGSAKSDYSNSTSQNSSSNSGESKKETSLKTIFEDCLKDVYSAEQQLVKALPEVAKAAFNEDLQDAFINHLEQTRRHVERLEKIFDRLSISKDGAKCEAMEGLIEETRKVITEYKDSPARDSALIIGAQKIEHYEIAAYGSLVELAEVMGYQKIADILDRTLQEEGDTDHLLTDLAMDINDEAMETSPQDTRNQN